MMVTSRTVCIVFVTLFGAVVSQITPSDVGCTFTDRDGLLYNVELVRGVDEVPCLSTQTLDGEQQYYQTQVNKIQTQAEALESTRTQLQEHITQLQREIARARRNVNEIKEQATNSGILRTTCPHGYTLTSDEYNSCYMFVARHHSWYDAESYCNSNHGHLVALETSEEQEYLMDHIQTSNVIGGTHMWTAGNDIAHEQEWVWAGINVPFDYTRWLLYPHTQNGPIQMPDNYLDQEHCVHLFHLHNYDWNDLYCGNMHYFICETKIVQP